MKPRSFAILGLLVLFGLLMGYLGWASFSANGSSDAATIEAYEPTKIEAQKQLTMLNNQRQQWDNLNIQNYEIVVSGHFGRALVYQYTVTVENNRVTDVQCETSPPNAIRNCYQSGQSYTVDSLFLEFEKFIPPSVYTEPEASITWWLYEFDVVYNAQYHYIESFFADRPRTYDLHIGWQVESFEVIE